MGNPDGPLRAMIIDSWYDSFVGVVMLVRVVDGRLQKGERIKMMASGATYNADNLGVFTPANQPHPSLEAGEVGYIIAGIKELQAAKVGDTVTLIKPGSGGAAFRRRAGDLVGGAGSLVHHPPEEGEISGGGSAGARARQQGRATFDLAGAQALSSQKRAPVRGNLHRHCRAARFPVI